MTTLTARLFFPGLAPGGVAVTARFAGPTLVIEGEGVNRRVPTLHMRVALGGFDGRQWRLEWPLETGGTAALLLPPADAAQLWLDTAPAHLRDQTAHGRRRERAGRRRLRLALAAFALLLLLPALLLAGFWFNADRLAGWAAGRVSPAQERRLGELAFAQLRPGLRLVEGGPAAEAVAAIGGRLSAGSVYAYRWYVADSPEVNAFALPGGSVVVYTGLLRAAGSAEEVAGVLAHEVQHVELRHSLRSLIHALGWRAVLAVALGDLSGGVWGGLAERLGNLGYGRDLERQADLEGLKALRRAGIAAHGMPAFFARLAAREGGGIALLASHPASAERMQALQRTIAAQGDYPAAPLPYDWTTIRVGLGR
jgi:Zn-dependent protease with chaperone function